MANGDLDLCQADGHRQRTTHGTADPMNTVNVVANVWIWIPLRRDETVAGLCRLTARLADLDAGDIETLVTETTRLALTGNPAHHTEKALAYFKTNAHRMRYAYFRDHGMFFGSGTVEAGCKAVIGQRLKLSGMRWNIPGATGILTLRCQHASGRWEQI
jgi:hypothetical protein